MQQVQRITTSNWSNVFHAVQKLVNDLNCNELETGYEAEVPQRWTFDDVKIRKGSIWILDTAENEEHQVEVYTHKGDYFAYAWFQYDGFDHAFLGQSLNGQAFEIENDLPVLVDL